MLSNTQVVVLKLIRVSITKHLEDIPANVDWLEVMSLASEQGILGLCFDAIDLLPLEQRPEINFLLEWLGQVSYMEKAYEQYRQVVYDLSLFYKSINIKMMLLKGYGLSLCWPRPNHRPVGDIDCYLYGRWQDADKILSERLGIEIDNSHHHHSVFTYESTMVENHYDFLNVHSHTSNKWIERMFKNLACDGNEIPDDNIHNLYYPSATFNAMYVARHAACHFASEKMTLRQLLDWAFLINAYHKDIDWNMFWQNVTKMGMADFVVCMNDICNKRLGFDREIFYEPIDTCRKEGLSERMLNDIFEPEDTGAEKKGMAYLYHRGKLWWTNRWKHKMVYSDSLLSTFLVQMKSHLMKPQTIFGV